MKSAYNAFTRIKFVKQNLRGFTLIELVIAISIMAIIGVLTFANYKPFGEDQNLKSAVLDIQSLLKTAQTNATTNTVCGTLSNSTWQVEFANATTINLLCQRPPEIPLPPLGVKTLTLDTNIQIQTVSGSPSLSCPSALPFTIRFDPLKSQANFENFSSCTSLTITLKNTKTTSTKSVIIEQGGRIYAP